MKTQELFKKHDLPILSNLQKQILIALENKRLSIKDIKNKMNELNKKHGKELRLNLSSSVINRLVNEARLLEKEKIGRTFHYKLNSKVLIWLRIALDIENYIYSKI
ncbi:MAG: hypothetical protein ACTSRI_18350 [Promethearchaeota archaeon]